MRTKPSVLVVDDSADSREMLAEYLAFRGFEISEAADGEQAIAVARRVRPDTILMDLSMPGMDGLEATRQLRADPLTSQCVIVAISGYGFPAQQQTAKNAGCDAFILKPFDLTILADTLHEVMIKGASAFDATALMPRTATQSSKSSWVVAATPKPISCNPQPPRLTPPSGANIQPMPPNPFDLRDGPPVPRKPEPTREPLFEFRLGHRTIACELRYDGESGVEAQFIESDGRVGLSQKFSTRALAVEWAEEHQRMMQREVDGRDVEV